MTEVDVAHCLASGQLYINTALVIQGTVWPPPYLLLSPRGSDREPPWEQPARA